MMPYSISKKHQKSNIFSVFMGFLRIHRMLRKRHARTLDKTEKQRYTPWSSPYQKRKTGWQKEYQARGTSGKLCTIQQARQAWEGDTTENSGSGSNLPSLHSLACCIVWSFLLF
jgi:hypothetical protein